MIHKSLKLEAEPDVLGGRHRDEQARYEAVTYTADAGLDPIDRIRAVIRTIGSELRPRRTSRIQRLTAIYARPAVTSPQQEAAAAAELRIVVARRIRYWARRRALGLNELADLAGVSRSQLFYVLARTSAPTIVWLAAVARVLDVEVHMLLREGRRGRS